MRGFSTVYTHGSIRRVMLSTAISMLPGTLAISGYNVVDTYFVSRLGTAPLAAMGFTFPVVMMVSCIYNGLGGGVMTPVAQLLGGGRRIQAARMVTGGVFLLALVGAVISFSGIALNDYVFHRLGAQDDLMPMIKEYMVIWYLGSLSVALGISGTHLLVSAGAPKLGGLMMMFGLLLNAVLDPLFIFGWGRFPGRGIAGAAIATIVAQVAALVAVVGVLHFKLRLIAPVTALFPYPRMLKSWRVILRYGIPATLGMILNPAGMAVVTRAVAATGGEAAVAAVSAAGRLEALAFIFPMSLGMSLLPMTGQNFGAKLYCRIDTCRRVSTLYVGIFLLAMSAVYYLLARPLSGFFSDDPEVVRLMTECLRITSWGFAFIEIHRYSTFFFIGCGRAKSGAALNVLRIVGFMVPLTLVALFFDSLEGVFCARLAADVLAGVIGWMLAKGLTSRLMHQEPAVTGGGCE